MPADDEVTELVEFLPTRVDGVASPANGTPFLLLKARQDDEGEDGESESSEDEDEGEGGDDSAVKGESEDIEREVTGTDADADVEKAEANLTKGEREKMDRGDFAYVDPEGERHLPVHDENHVRAAIGRFNQTDFSGADDPADAKAKAARKIKAAAGEYGIDLSPDSNVAQAAAKSAGVPDASVAEPQPAGVIDGSKSGLGPTMTEGKWVRAANSSEFLAGETPYAIPTIGKLKTEEIPATTDGAGLWAAKGIVAASLIEAMDGLFSQRQAMKDGGLGADGMLNISEPSGEAVSNPSSMPWESYDSCTYAQVAQVLAEACHALMALEQRELVEGVTGDEGDFADAAETAAAREALDYAIGVAARLSFHEMAESQAEGAAKSGRIISSKNEQSLKAARDHLNTVLEGVEKTDDAGDGKEDMIVTDVTKQELAEMIAAASAEAVKTAMNTASNNNGEVDTDDIKPTGETDANDVTAIPNGDDVKPEYVNKEEASVAELAKSVADMHDTLQKIAKRPRQGGPSLDGQARGVDFAAEGRFGEASKSEASEVERLSKQLEEATDPQVRDQIGEKLTYLRLREMHEQGRL